MRMEKKANLTNKTDKNKRILLNALEKSLGVVTTACKSTKLDRSTHYDWMVKDAEYAKKVEEIQNIAIDFAESKLHEQINGGNITGIIFYLKTKGKKRGYIERSEVRIDAGKPDFSDYSTEELIELSKYDKS